MNAVWQWFRGTETVGVPSDCLKPGVDETNVYPVHALDQMAEYQPFLATVMLFNDALDADMLYVSLSRVLEIDDWRKLGGRLKKDSNGRLQMHVPSKFSAKEPAVTYTHECLAHMKISHHPVAKQLPTRRNATSLQPFPQHKDFQTLQVRPDFPTSLDVSMTLNLPLLSLHIHTFQDATVVGLAWPHMLMDGAARSALMKSWSLVMTGREDEVPLVAGARHDVLSDLPSGTDDQDDFLVSKRWLRGIRLAKFILWQGWEKLTGPSKRIQTIYMPRAAYKSLVGGIKDQVSQIRDETGDELYISEADAITAWITQQLASTEPGHKPVMIMSILNCRYLLKQHISLEKVYLQNMLIMNYTRLSAEEARGAVAPLALNCRSQLSEQTTEPRVISFIQWLKKRIGKTRHTLPLCGDEDAIFLCCNSLLKACLITETNFAPAVLRRGEAAETRQNPAGSMVNFFFGAVKESFASVNVVTILGRDHSGGVWFSGNLPQPVWDVVEQNLGQVAA